MAGSSIIAFTTPAPDTIGAERLFKAQRDAVFAAFTQPDLIRQWMSGPDDWAMTTCVVAPEAGGRLHYVWECSRDGLRMTMDGEMLAFEAPDRIVHTERFDDGWYPGEAEITIRFIPIGKITRVMTLMRYESEAARNTVLEAPIGEGMALGYRRLDALLAGEDPQRV